MINQTIVSLGGAYVERVSNPPDVHNLQTSRSVGGGVSNGCKSNERNVGREQRSALGVYKRFGVLRQQNIFSNIFFSPYSSFSKCPLSKRFTSSCCSGRRNKGCLFYRNEHSYFDNDKSILGRHNNFFPYSKQCRPNVLLLGNRLNSESGVVA